MLAHSLPFCCPQDWLMSSLDQSGTDEWLPVEVEHQDDFAALMTAIHAARTSRLIASGQSLMEQAQGLTASPAAWGQELPRVSQLQVRLAEELELWIEFTQNTHPLVPPTSLPSLHIALSLACSKSCPAVTTAGTTGRGGDVVDKAHTLFVPHTSLPCIQIAFSPPVQQELPRLSRLRVRLAEEVELSKRLQQLVVGKRGEEDEVAGRNE
ncbi:unnamed protein product [Closterium sp. Naga37s-1]|nr:unnamed protein product [Closterium sp. Naga37s-1]